MLYSRQASLQFLTFDGLRGIAALMVAARHVPNLWPAHAPTGFMFESYLAVDLFFMLSGFVLCHAYGDALRNGLSGSQFAVLRLIRIYPLYALSILIVFMLEYARKVYFNEPIRVGWDLVYALALLPNPGSTDQVLFPENAPAWTLLFEMVASVCFGASRSLRSLPQVVVVAVVAAGGLLAVVLHSRLGVSSAGALDLGHSWATADAGLVRVAFGFFAGVGLNLVWRQAPRVPRVPAWLLGCVAAGVLAARPPEGFEVAYDFAAVLVVFPALILLGAFNAPGPRVGRLMAWAGAVSYGVYILQAPVFRVLTVFLVKTGLHGRLQHPALLGGVYVGAVVIVAAIAVRFYDAPLRRALRAGLVRARTA